MTKKSKGAPARAKTQSTSVIAGFSPSDLKALLTSLAHLSDDTDDEALDLAQEKAFEAMEAPTARKRVALARQALALSEQCADAYVVLAWEAKDPDEALDLYRRAVTAGAEPLGDAMFENDAGSFWGLIQTRPYMRARHELAMALWSRGAHDEAVSHFQDMLRLNPNDNQGIRYLLMDALLELGREGDAAVLLETYKDDGSAAWAWSGALLAFRRTKGGPAARAALTKAVATNRHVPDYLLARKPLPRALPNYIGIGDEDEAVAYVDQAASAWTAAPGATAWVAATLANETLEGGPPLAQGPSGSM